MVSNRVGMETTGGEKWEGGKREPEEKCPNIA